MTVSSLYAEDVCGFCQGWGHHANECASKKRIDKMCKINKTFHGVWGSIKASYLSRVIPEFVEMGCEGREEHADENRSKKPYFGFSSDEEVILGAKRTHTEA